MIKIISVGKIKEKYLIDAIDEYKKRLSKYIKIEEIELKDYSNLPKEVILKKEAEDILKNINDRDYVITLEILGNILSTEEWKIKYEEILINNSNIVFVIGSSYGLDDSIEKRSNYKLSFSRMTFPHQLFKVILLEQIYRIYKMMNNEEYHK